MADFDAVDPRLVERAGYFADMAEIVLVAEGLSGILCVRP